MTERDRWNTRLTPPPGGLERLSRTLAMRGAARPQVSRRWPMVFAAACSACLALGIGLYLRDAPRRVFEQSLRDALAQSAMANQDATEDTAPPPLRELPSSRPDVRIVLVALQPIAQNDPQR